MLLPSKAQIIVFWGPEFTVLYNDAYRKEVSVSEDRTKALASGFQIHVAKPIDPAELVATVAALARRRVVARDRPGA